MPKHLYLLILLTLITGMASGVYAFFLTRTPDTKTPEPQTEEGYEVIAYTYGGCERVGCSSFRLQDDGTYTYLTRTLDKGNERFEDALSLRQRDELEALIMTASLEQIRESTYSGTCPVTYDGIAYRFELRVEDERYSFDSCIEALDEEALFVLLTKYFNIMDVTFRGA